MTEDEQMRRATNASIAAQSDDHGGKMPIIDLVDDGGTPTPSPPPSHIYQTQHPSTMSTMGSHPSTLSQGQGGCALLLTFNAAGSQVMQGKGTNKSAAERSADRNEIAQRMLNRLLSKNSSNMHNDKDSSILEN